jgi:ELWxxDGT repeat protein
MHTFLRHSFRANPFFGVLAGLCCLWCSPDLRAQPRPVKDVTPLTATHHAPMPGRLAPANRKLHVNATPHGHGKELWQSEGTAAGTTLLINMAPGRKGSAPAGSTPVNGVVYFAAFDRQSGRELWKSDGTAAGTVRVKDIYPGAPDGLDAQPDRWLAGAGHTVFFVANDGMTGGELWKSDGTEAGTVLVKDIRPGSLGANPSNLVELNGTVYFVANDGVNGNELWKSDGTEAGTVLVKDLRPGPAGVAPVHLTAFRNNVYFVANDGRTGRELWKSDGTAASTVLVKDINRGPVNSNPGQLFDVNGSLYFIAEDALHGRELWKSDGTGASTVLVKDILPGAGSGFPYYAIGLTPVGDTLYFTADDGLSGPKCWQSDGTATGTVRMGDSCPGRGPNSSPNLTHGNK